MEKLTGEQIIEKLKEAEIDIDSFAYGDYNPIELGLGEFEEVHHKGGEDEGSHWESVQYFKDHDVYLKVTGYYQSYSGTSFNGWEDVTEVKPTERTITVYE